VLIVATGTIAAAPLELLALGLAGVAVVVAVGSALAALGSRRALQALDEPADEEAPA
jgi:membrane protein implicated in regulation of membrane protease activity